LKNQVGRDTLTWSLQVLQGYSAVLLSVSSSLFPKPQSIVLNGIIKYTNNSLIKEIFGFSVPVSIDIIQNGVTRTLKAISNTNGTFSVVFFPTPLEYGYYQAISRHPTKLVTDPQIDWKILGFKSIPSSVYLNGEAVSMFEKTFYNATVLYNDGPAPLSELKLRPLLPNTGIINVHVFFEGMPHTRALEPGDIVTLNIKLSASKPVKGIFGIIVDSSEGTMIQIIVNFHIEPILPNFLIEPSSLSARIIRGTSRIFEFAIVNTGRTVANNVHSLLPQTDFISLVSFGHLEQNSSKLSLKSGQTAVLSLLIKIPLSQDLGDISATIAVVSTEISASIPLRFMVSSNLLMNLTIIVEDEFTYFASGEPLVNDASITLINYQHDIRIILTAEAGMVIFTNIYEDHYEMSVEAPDHQSLQQIIVTSAAYPVITVFLQRQTVTYTWSVIPVTFEDIYEIHVESDFVTHVPIPIVTVVPEEIDLELFELGYYTALQINITNHGLVRANNTVMELFRDHPSLEFSSTTNDIGYIEPLSSIIITINISKKSTKKRFFPIIVPVVKVIGSGLLRGAASTAARAAVTRYRSTLSGIARARSFAFRTQWVVYPIKILYQYLCGDLQIFRYITKFLKQLTIIEITLDSHPLPVISQPISSSVQCTDCRMQTSSSINFNGYSAKTPAFCNKCFSAIIGCWPTPEFPYAGCVPTIVGGTTPLDPLTEKKPIDDKALINQLGWVQCVASNTFKKLAKTVGYATCIYGVYECLKEIFEDKKRHTRSIDAITFELVEAMLPVIQNVELGIEVVGDDTWLTDVADPLWLSQILQPTLDDSSEAGVMISTTELHTILAAPSPNGTTTEMVQRLVERLNNTLHGWNNGKLEPMKGENMASFSKIQELNENITTFNYKAVAKGFSSFLDAYNFASGEVNKLNSWEDEAGVCAVVRIRVEQELAVTRTAFLAKLEIENMDNSPLKDGCLTITIFDSGTGEVATHLFAISNGSLSGSLTDGDGEWTLASEASGSVADNTIF